MNILQFAFYTAGVLYALIIKQVLLVPFIAIHVLYYIFSTFLPKASPLSTRKKIMQTFWGEPNCPSLYLRVPVRTEQVEKIIASSSAGSKLTLTHFCIKALG